MNAKEDNEATPSDAGAVSPPATVTQGVAGDTPPPRPEDPAPTPGSPSSTPLGGTVIPGGIKIIPKIYFCSEIHRKF